MPRIEEWFEWTSDTAVGEQDVRDFQARVAWPAMNSLCNIKFVEESRPDDYYHVEKLIGDNWYDLELGYVDPDDFEDMYEEEEQEEDEPDVDEENYIFATLTVSRRRPDLLEELKKSNYRDRVVQTSKDRAAPRPEPDEAELATGGEADIETVDGYDGITAWEVRRFHFSPDPEQGIAVNIAYELVDDKAVIYSTESPVEWSDIGRTEQEHEAEEVFSESLTQKDLALMQKGFAALGVNPVFLEWYPVQ